MDWSTLFQVKDFNEQRLNVSGVYVQVHSNVLLVQLVQFGHLLDQLQKDGASFAPLELALEVAP